MLIGIPTPTPPQGYQILSLLGRGTNSVYLARNPRGYSVALKYVDPFLETALDEERRGCTFQQILVALSTQQVRITECKGWDGRWIIYGFVEGQELAKTPEASRCKNVIVNRLLEGVLLFARLGIMHRDLKPENIMVNKWDQDCEDIQVTFLNFGKAIGDMSNPNASESLDDAFVKGRQSTPYAWTPPEVRHSKFLGSFKPSECIVDLRKYGSYDVWGIGSIAFWLTHSSSSSCTSDLCLDLDAYTCSTAVAHGVADVASCPYAQASTKDMLVGEDSATKIMLTVEPCCRPTAGAILNYRMEDMEPAIEACTQEQRAARASVKISPTTQSNAKKRKRMAGATPKDKVPKPSESADMAPVYVTDVPKPSGSADMSPVYVSDFLDFLS